MAKLILKAPYYKRGHKTEDGRGRGGYAEYIATREGVELCEKNLRKDEKQWQNEDRKVTAWCVSVRTDAGKRAS